MTSIINELLEDTFDRVTILLKDVSKAIENQSNGGLLGGLGDNVQLLQDILNMSMKELDSFTVFGFIKTNDVVRAKADQYLLEHFQYFMDPKVLEILGWKKPVLDEKRLDIINSDPKNKEFYQKFGRLWTVLLADHELDAGKVNSDLIKKDIQKIASSKIYVKQTMLIYSYAYLEKNPNMKLYIRSSEVSKIWANRAKEYYLSEDYGKRWLKLLHEQQQVQDVLTAIDLLFKQYQATEKLIDYIPKNFSSLDYVTSDIRAKVDLLDPTGKTGNEIISHLQNISLYYQIFEGGINDELFDSQLKTNVETLFNGFLALDNPNSSQQPIVKFIKDFSGLGNLAGAIEATCDIVKKVKDRFNELIKTGGHGKPEELSAAELEIVTQIVDGHSNSTQIKSLSKYTKIFGSIFRACQVMIIFTGIISFDPDAPIINNTQFVAESISNCVDFLTSFERVDRYVTFKFSSGASRLAKVFSKFTPTRLGQFFSKNFTKIFTKSTNSFITYRICPILLLISCYNNVLDAKTDIEEENWGGLACDLAQLGCNIVAAIILLAGVPFAALGALILGAIVVGLYLIKIFVFPSKTPIQKYYESEYFPQEYKLAPPA